VFFWKLSGRGGDHFKEEEIVHISEHHSVSASYISHIKTAGSAVTV